MPEIRSELALQALVALSEKLKASPTLTRKVPQHAQQELQVIMVDLLGKLQDLFKGLGGVSFLGFGLSFRNKNKDKEGDGFQLVARDNYQKTVDLLKRIATQVSFRIVVDDPEAIFAAYRNINENLIAALAIAAHDLNKEIANFKCVILIKPNVLQTLKKVDEFVNIPKSASVRLCWSDDELSDVIRKCAEAAKVKLADVFNADPKPALATIVKDSRSGPRDALQRLVLHFENYPDQPVTPASLEESIGGYGEACFAQIQGPYEKQYPGLTDLSILLFEGRHEDIPASKLGHRLDQLIASSKILAYKNEPWANNAPKLADLLVQFGLVAVRTPKGVVLPFHASYLDEATKADAVFTMVPGLRGRLKKPLTIPPADKASQRKKGRK